MYRALETVRHQPTQPPPPLQNLQNLLPLKERLHAEACSEELVAPKEDCHLLVQKRSRALGCWNCKKQQHQSWKKPISTQHSLHVLRRGRRRPHLSGSETTPLCRDALMLVGRRSPKSPRRPKLPRPSPERRLQRRLQRRNLQLRLIPWPSIQCADVSGARARLHGPRAWRTAPVTRPSSAPRKISRTSGDLIARSDPPPQELCQEVGEQVGIIL